MLNRADKQTLVDSVSEDFDKAAGILFLDFTGLTVEEANSFRRTLQKDDVKYQVVKNTLVKRALAGRPYEEAGNCLSGSPTGVVMGWEDPVTSAKSVFDFIKECKHLRVKGGVVEDKAIGPAEAESLSKMPSKDEMQASIVGLALSPGAQLASQLKSSGSKVLGAIEALIEKLEKSES